MRPAGELHSAIFDWLPLEAVEEEDDGHDQGRHHTPRQGPVQVEPENKETIKLKWFSSGASISNKVAFLS